MTLNDFVQWIKTLEDMPPAELGNLNANKEHFIALYPLSAKDIQAVGWISSYNVIGVRLKIRYGKNFTTAESKILQIKEQLDNVRNTQMNDVKVLFINTEQPKFDGKDTKGVFEFTLNARIYYERS